MIVPVLQLGEFGMLPDQPPHRLPLNALTQAKNVRFAHEGLMTGGRFERLPALSITDSLVDLYFLPDGSIVLCGVQKLYRYYPSTGLVTTIYPGTFTGTLANRWLGGMFNNFLVLTNGVDPPVYYDYNSAGNAVAVPGWMSGRRTPCIRPLVYHLVALGVTASGTPDSRRVWWSKSAEPNTMPTSWDTGVYTSDAGEVTLPNGIDPIIDGLQLGTSFIIYTREQTWLMRYIGGTQVFAFSQLSNSSGLLAPGCAVHLQGYGHVALTRNDVVLVSDSVVSIAEGKVRNWIFGRMDSASYVSSRVLHLPHKKEVLLFFPERGSGYPNLAAIWNYGMNTWSYLELEDPVRAVAYKGPSVYSEIYTIESDTAQCNANDGVICDDTPATYESAESLVSLVDVTRLGEYRPADSVQAEVVRTGISHLAPNQQDEWHFKRVLSLRLDVTGPGGAIIVIDYGSKMSHYSDVQWLGSVNYTIGVTEEAQFEVVGRFVAFRFKWSDPNVRFLGYFYDIHSLGEAF